MKLNKKASIKKDYSMVMLYRGEGCSSVTVGSGCSNCGCVGSGCNGCGCSR